MSKKSVIIDITRADGCGSDLLALADELTAGNVPGDSEIPEGKAPVWMNMKEVEQGHGSKIKMDYIPCIFPTDGLDPEVIKLDDPTMAMRIGDVEDGASCAGKFFAENKDQMTKTDCGDYDLYLYKMPKPFVAGEVVDKDGECAKDVKVKLTCKKCGTTFDTTTDFFGDFEFKDLPADVEVLLEVEGAAPVEFKLDEAKDLGVITLC